jgi:uncharacterized membrane protein
VALFTNDAVVLGILIAVIAIFATAGQSQNPILKKIFKFVPPVLFFYFVPSFLVSLNIISVEKSNLYFMATRYLLPTLLVLLTLSIDLKAIVRLGPKSIIMFFAATFGVIVGGPLAIMIVSIFSPETVGGAGPDAVWRAFSTLAGTWIGASANQAAMKEVFMPSDQLFSAVVLADVFVGGLWLAVLFVVARNRKRLDKAFGACTKDIDDLTDHMNEFQLQNARIPSVKDLLQILGIGFVFTALAHVLGDILGPYIGANYPTLSKFSLNSSFLWIVLLASAFGIMLSFTRASKLEGAGASKVGTIMLYILIATIGMHMDIMAIVKYPGIILTAFLWMFIHAVIIFIVAKLIRAPMFYLAIGSQANIGGAASAPIVAAEFHPALMPIGVLFAVLGYAIGNYGAWICTQLMQMVAPV